MVLGLAADLLLRIPLIAGSRRRIPVRYRSSKFFDPQVLLQGSESVKCCRPVILKRAVHTW